MQDKTLYEDADGLVGNGAGNVLIAGRTLGRVGTDELVRRALLKFDIAGNILPGSTISNASLELRVLISPTGATAPISMSIHKVT